MKSVLSIDWLSYYGEFSGCEPNEPYHYKERDYGTKVFSRVVDLLYFDRIVASISFSPRSSVLEPNSAIIKFENSVLYEPNFCALREQILSACEFKVKSINRLDLALDFNYFQNGLEGHCFISQFVKDIYLHNGRGKFSITGIQQFTSNYEYLRLGSGSSPVVAYLYNKSKEMEDVKLKPYIVQRWKDNGLRQDVPVWRLEFSMKSDFFLMCDTDLGCMPLCYDCDFRNMQEIKDLYYSLYCKYWDFRKNNGTKNKSRMPKIELIDMKGVCCNYRRLQAKNQSGRRERILLHNLYKFTSRYDVQNEESRSACERVKNTLIYKHGLQDYYELKKDYWDSTR